MEDIKAKASNLLESTTEYLETYYKYTVLNLADKATGITAGVVGAIVLLLLGLFVLFFSGLALGIWLGSLVNNPALGYLIVAGLYLLLIVLFLAFKKNLVFPYIRNLTINKLYDTADKDV